MIRITDKSLCCGCTACMNACPVQCIVMRRDREGFDYPVANPDICIGCGRCEEVCPVLNPLPERDTLEVKAAKCPEYISESSSGGVFSALAEDMVRNGGVVYGAAFESGMQVGHIDVDSVEGLSIFRGSKYVQSDLYSVFEEIRDLLDEGRNVLFSGTPCQVAGLHKYLGSDRPGLLTADIACHGVPSPGLWERYRAAQEKDFGEKIVRVNFRDKTSSWRQYKVAFETASGKVISTDRFKNPYMALFLQDMTLRPSCYNCPARNGKSGSDITLADLWNVPEAAPAYHDDKGTSAVFVYTQKGIKAVSDARFDSIPVDPIQARKRNGGFDGKRSVPERRQEFFSGLGAADIDLIPYMKGFVYVKPVHKVVYEKIHTVLSKTLRKLKK